MRKLISIIITITAWSSLYAQEDRTGTIDADKDKTTINENAPSLNELSTPNATVMPTATQPAISDFKKAIKPATQDTLHLPTLTNNGQALPINAYPYYWGGYGLWDLHSGLNMNIGASVFAQFGHKAYHGAGFAQNISMMYAMPITNKLSLAVGGYFNNIYWAHDSYRDAGISAVLGYKFDDHWEGYVYGQKSLMNRQMPMPLYDMNNIGDRIGAAVKYNFNPNFSIQISVEQKWMPNQRGTYYHDNNNGDPLF